MDCPQGYHQTHVDKATKEKLAFAGSYASKYTYWVMLFRPVNGPTIFIMFAHDMDISWNELAKSNDIVIDERTNTKLIVDDILSWAITYGIALQYLQCKLISCCAQNILLNLKKCHFFQNAWNLLVPTSLMKATDQCNQSKISFVHGPSHRKSVMLLALCVFAYSTQNGSQTLRSEQHNSKQSILRLRLI